MILPLLIPSSPDPYNPSSPGPSSHYFDEVFLSVFLFKRVFRMLVRLRPPLFVTILEVFNAFGADVVIAVCFSDVCKGASIVLIKVLLYFMIELS